MISLQPQTQFTIVRQLPDPADGTTYYIRAVVRNSVDDTILQTINLTDKGSRRFKGTYELPADMSGMGLYIDITTTVYTDDTYTTKSTTYSEELEQYLVWDRITKLGGGGGGGSDIDYKRIQKMIETIKENIPEMKEADYSPILSSLQEIKKCVEGIEMPEMEKTEIAPVLTAIKDTEYKLSKAIKDIKIPESKEVNLTPVLQAISEKGSEMEDAIEMIEKVAKRVNDITTEKTAYTEMQKLAKMMLPFLQTEDMKEDKKESLQDIARKL